MKKIHRRFGAATAALVGALALGGLAISPAYAQPKEGASVANATEVDVQAAQDAFKEAMQFEERELTEQALAKYVESFGAVSSPNSLLKVVRLQRLLGQRVDAYRSALLGRRIAEDAAAFDTKYEPAIDAFAVELSELESMVGLVTVTALTEDPNATVWVDGIEVAPEQLDPLVLDPGTATIELRAGGEQKAETVTVAAGEKKWVELAIQKEAPPAPPPVEDDGDSVHPFDMGTGQRITGIAVAGVGAVGLVVGAIFGARHNSLFSDLEDSCVDGQCDPALAETADDGKTAQTVANIGLIGGGVLFTAGAALFATSFLGDDEETGLTVRVGPTSASIVGEF